MTTDRAAFTVGGVAFHVADITTSVVFSGPRLSGSLINAAHLARRGSIHHQQRRANGRPADMARGAWFSARRNRRWFGDSRR